MPAYNTPPEYTNIMLTKLDKLLSLTSSLCKFVKRRTDFGNSHKLLSLSSKTLKLQSRPIFAGTKSIPVSFKHSCCRLIKLITASGTFPKSFILRSNIVSLLNLSKFGCTPSKTATKKLYWKQYPRYSKWSQFI